LIEGASWRLVGRQAGESAGDDGRRSVGKRSWKVGWRRELKAGWKAGSEDGLKAQAGDRPDGWLKDLTVDENWRSDWKAAPES